ncbi:hypothetical protein PALB_14230 [Pseudoalteromonas luteoviolacea B = ATCC 29581]|nr:hypothetical protein PALB_14230 [Pseudoalteromonas luteoviolacea B = ATCC 29581]
MENRTLKHSDWLKIVDSRDVKTIRKQSNVVTRKRPLSQLWLSLIISAAFIMLGFNLMESEEAVLNPELSGSAKQRIERHFSKQFMMGSWQLSRVKFNRDEIGIYIQIPNELALSAEDQKHYIQYSLCPPADDYIWQTVGNYGLFIHLYTNNLRNSQFAECLRA